jgi:hypothetical protein
VQTQRRPFDIGLPSFAIPTPIDVRSVIQDQKVVTTSQHK